MANLKFSSQADSPFLRWHPVREALDESYRIYRLFLEPITKEDKERLLPKIKRDSAWHRELHLRCATWAPDGTTAINLLLNSVFGDEPERGYQGSESLEAWSENVDRLHTDLSAYSRKITRLSMTYGSAYTLLNLPKRPEGFEASSLDQEQGYLMPILRAFTPLELLNWKLDGGDELSEVWFITNEVMNNEWVYKWYHVTKTQYFEYALAVKAGEDEDPVLVADGTHGFGFVPVVPSYYEMVEPMIGDSYIKESAPLDIKKFGQEADAEYDRALVCHPQMYIKSKEDYGVIEVDAGKYLRVGPDDEAGYIQQSQETYRVNQEAILQTRMDIARKLQIDPLGFVIEQGKLQISGVSRQLSFALRESDMLTRIADIAEDFEARLLDMAYRIVENEEPVDVFSAYPKDFTLNSIDTQMEIYLKIGDQIPSPTYHAEMLKLFARAQLGNKPSVVEVAENEIDAAKFPASEPAPPTPPPTPQESDEEDIDEAE